MSVEGKKDKQGRRKLLALDGRGIRGAMTLEVLEKIESELQGRLGRGDDFALADYFDYVAGTSTGAIIATGLSKYLGTEPLAVASRYFVQNNPVVSATGSVPEVAPLTF